MLYSIMTTLTSTCPTTLEQATNRLIEALDDDTLDAIAATPREELDDYHLMLGTFIRNELGLWYANKSFLEDCGTDNPDDATGFILWMLWEELQEK